MGATKWCGDNALLTHCPGDTVTADVTSPNGPIADTGTDDPVTAAPSTWGTGETEAVLAAVEIAAAGTSAPLSLAPCG